MNKEIKEVEKDDCYKCGESFPKEELEEYSCSYQEYAGSCYHDDTVLYCKDCMEKETGIKEVGNIQNGLRFAVIKNGEISAMVIEEPTAHELAEKTGGEVFEILDWGIKNIYCKKVNARDARIRKSYTRYFVSNHFGGSRFSEEGWSGYQYRVPYGFSSAQDHKKELEKNGEEGCKIYEETVIIREVE